jgi:hypothetical protein
MEGSGSYPPNGSGRPVSFESLLTGEDIAIIAEANDPTSEANIEEDAQVLRQLESDIDIDGLADQGNQWT